MVDFTSQFFKYSPVAQLVERMAVRVSSSCEKSQDEKRVNSGKPFDEKGNPEPSPKREGAETRHSLPKSKQDTVKV